MPTGFLPPGTLPMGGADAGVAGGGGTMLDDVVQYLQTASQSFLGFIDTLILTLSSLLQDFPELLDNIQSIIQQLQFPPWVIYRDALRDTLGDVHCLLLSSYHLLYLTCRPFIIGASMMMKSSWTCIIKPTVVYLYRYQMSLSTFQVLLELGTITIIILLYLLRRFIQKRRYIPRFQKYCTMKKRLVVSKYNAILNRIAQTNALLAYVLPHVVYFALVGVIRCTSWGRWIVRSLATETYLIRALTLWLPLVRTVMLVGKWKYREYMIHHPTEDKGGRADGKNKKGTTTTTKQDIILEGQRKKNGISTSSISGKVGGGSAGSSSAGAGDGVVGLKDRIAMFEKKKSSLSSTSTTKNEGGTTASSSSSPPRKQKKGTKINDGWMGESKTSSSTPPSSSSSTSSSSSDKDLFSAGAAMELLKYWIVYSLLLALFELLRMIPFIGSLLLSPDSIDVQTVAMDDADGMASGEAAAVGTIQTVGLALTTLQTFWQQRSLYVQEWNLILIVWVWTFQALRGGGGGGGTDDGDDDGTVISGGVVVVKRYNASPLDVLYDQLSSTLTPLYEQATGGRGGGGGGPGRRTSSSVTAQSSSSGAPPPPGIVPYGNKRGLTYKVLSKIDSFLSVAVLVRLISESTKTFLLRLMSDGTDFVPTVVTLFMPSYFTKWGGTYGGCVVPSLYGMACHDSYMDHRRRHRKLGKWDKTQRQREEETMSYLEGETMSRHLVFWVVYHALVRSVLLNRSNVVGAVVYWIPLSMHLVTVSVLAMQLFNGADWLYRGLEYELVAFGLIDRRYTSLAGRRGGKGTGGGNGGVDGSGTNGGEEDEHLDLDNTATVRVLRKVMRSLPSASSASGGSGTATDDGTGDQTNDGTGVQGVGGGGGGRCDTGEVSDYKSADGNSQGEATIKEGNDKTFPTNTSPAVVPPSDKGGGGSLDDGGTVNDDKDSGENDKLGTSSSSDAGAQMDTEERKDEPLPLPASSSPVDETIKEDVVSSSGDDATRKVHVD